MDTNTDASGGARFCCKACSSSLIPGKNPLDVLKNHQRVCKKSAAERKAAAGKKRNREESDANGERTANGWRSAEATLAARILQLQRTLVSAGIPVPPQRPPFLKYLETIPEGAVGAVARLRNGDVDAPRHIGSASGGYDDDGDGDIGQDGGGGADNAGGIDDDNTGLAGGFGGACGVGLAASAGYNTNSGDPAGAGGIVGGIGHTGGDMDSSGGIGLDGGFGLDDGNGRIAAGIGTAVGGGGSVGQVAQDGDEEVPSPPPLQIEGISRSGRVRRAVQR